MDSQSLWVEMGEVGEEKVVASIPKGFAYFRNRLVPCCHGYGHEEIDLAVTGPTGIWSIEVKNWRGIAYPGDYPDEVFFQRNTPSGDRISYRNNPYIQARDHAHDLHEYLKHEIGTWFPAVKTLVVFATYDRYGANGVSLYRIRHSNPSIIYLHEMQERLSDPSQLIRIWANRLEVEDSLRKLPTRERS